MSYRIFCQKAALMEVCLLCFMGSSDKFLDSDVDADYSDSK